MELEVYWTDFSKQELRNIFEFYKENASVRVAKSLVIGITHENLNLKSNQQLVNQKSFWTMIQETSVI